MKENRKGWVDVLRGLSVFLVVMGHIWHGSIFHLFVNQFKMPMFYILSGFLFSPNTDPVSFLKKILFRLGIPWLLFSLIWLKLPIYIVMGDLSKAYSTIISFISGNSLWFIPSFFLSQCIFYTVCKLSKNKMSAVFIASVMCFFVGFISADSRVLHFWCFDTALTSIVFMYAGYYLKNHPKTLENITRRRSTLLLLLYIVLCFVGICIHPSASLNFHTIEYGNLPMNILLMAIGIATAISVAIFIEQRYELPFLKMLGRNSIVVYLLSSNTVPLVRKLASMINIDITTNIAISFIAAVIVCTFNAFVSELCTKNAPWSVGLRKR